MHTAFTSPAVALLICLTACPKPPHSAPVAALEKSSSSTIPVQRTEPMATAEPVSQEPDKDAPALRLTLEHNRVAEAKNTENPELNFTHIHLLEGDPANPAQRTFVGKLQGECSPYFALEDLQNEGSTKANTLLFFLQCWLAGQGMDVSVWQSATKVEVKTRLTGEAIGSGDEPPRKTKRTIAIETGTSVTVGDRQGATVQVAAQPKANLETKATK